MKDIEKLISPFVENQFPSFYREEGPQFIAFVKAYYEWMEQTGNITNMTRSLTDFRDIDSTLEDFIVQFKEKYLKNIQFDTATNKRLLIKNSLDLYRSKGTERSIDLFFKLVYGTDAEVKYPGENILRASDGIWQKPEYLEIAYSPYNIEYVGKQIIGALSGAKAFVEKYIRRRTARGYVNLLYISSVEGQFRNGEIIGINVDNTADYTKTKRAQLIGSIDRVTIIDKGQSFAVGDIVSFQGSQRGQGGLARVTSVSDATGVVDFIFVDGGYGYTLNATSLISEKVLSLSNITANVQSNQYFNLFEQMVEPVVNIAFTSASTTLAAGDYIYRYAANGQLAGTGVILDTNQIGANGQITVGHINGVITNNVTYYTTSNAASLFANTMLDRTIGGKIMGIPEVYTVELTNQTGTLEVGQTVVQKNTTTVFAYGTVNSISQTPGGNTVVLTNARGAFKNSASLASATYISGTGTITANTSNNIVTGSGTTFDTNAIGSVLYLASGNVALGTVQSVLNSTSLTLTANASVNTTANTFNYGPKYPIFVDGNYSIFADVITTTATVGIYEIKQYVNTIKYQSANNNELLYSNKIYQYNSTGNIISEATILTVDHNSGTSTGNLTIIPVKGSFKETDTFYTNGNTGSAVVVTITTSNTGGDYINSSYARFIAPISNTQSNVSSISYGSGAAFSVGTIGDSEVIFIGTDLIGANNVGTLDYDRKILTVASNSGFGVGTYVYQTVNKIAFNANSSVNATSGFIALPNANTLFTVGDNIRYEVAAGNTVLNGMVNGDYYHVRFANTTGVILSYPYRKTNYINTSNFSTFANNKVNEEGHYLYKQVYGTVFESSTGVVKIKDRVNYFGNTGGTANVTTSANSNLIKYGTTTNLLTYSEEFDHSSWTKTRSSISSNAVISPDGTISADFLIEDTTSSQSHLTRKLIAGLASTTYTQSLFVKAGTRTKGQLQFYGNSGGSTVTFDLVAGTSTAAGAYGGWANASTTITAYDNGWYRITNTATTNAGLTSFNFSVLLADASGNGTYTGDGTSGFYVWGAQLEQASSAGTYVKTTGTTIPRASDTNTAISAVTVYTTLVQANVPYGGESIRAAAYGFPKNPQGDLADIIYSCLNFGRFEIGTIGALDQVDPGAEYNVDPYVLAYQPYVSAFGRNDFVITVNNATSTFVTGERINQTLANLVYYDLKVDSGAYSNTYDEIQISINTKDEINSAADFIYSPSNTVTFNGNTSISNNFIAITGNPFSSNDYIRYYTDTGNTAVTGLSNNSFYYVGFSNSTGITLSATAGGANIALTAGATESGHNIRNYVNDLVDNQRILYRTPAANTFIPGLANNTAYYIVSANTVGFKLSATKGGSVQAINASATVETHTISTVPGYLPGDRVYQNTSPVMNAAVHSIFSNTTGDYVRVSGNTAAINVTTSNTLFSYTNPYVNGAVSNVSLYQITSTAKGIIKTGSNSSVLYVKRLTFENTFQAGSEIIGDVSGSVADVLGVSEDPNELYPIGLNAEIEANVITSNGQVTSLEVFDSGFGYTNAEIIQYVSEDGLRAGSAKIVIDGAGQGKGYYRSSKGFLSEDMYIHDGDYYQEYSYEVLSKISFDRYADMFKKVMHIAGTKFFGSAVIIEEANVALALSQIGTSTQVKFNSATDISSTFETIDTDLSPNPFSNGDVVVYTTTNTAVTANVSLNFVTNAISSNVFTVSNNNFRNGDIVTYRRNGGTANVGLIEGDDYFVRNANSTTLKLANSSGKLVNVYSNATGETHILRIEKLANNQSYYVVNTAANTVKLSLTSNGSPINITANTTTSGSNTAGHYLTKTVEE